MSFPVAIDGTGLVMLERFFLSLLVLLVRLLLLSLLLSFLSLLSSQY